MISVMMRKLCTNTQENKFTTRNIPNKPGRKRKKYLVEFLDFKPGGNESFLSWFNS